MVEIIIGNIENVNKEFETKRFYAGAQKDEYKGSTEFYSIQELSIEQFNEKYKESIWMSRGFTVYLNDIIRDMDGTVITIIGDTALNSIFTILI